uniref:Microtubule-associated protein MAP65-1b n=1 Tax=Solanum tuberosum TaxID=4113 RepID=M1AZ74_SOLTU
MPIDNVGYVALVDSLIAKTRAWEQDRDTIFTYDGVPLLAMLDEYMMLRQDREEEKRKLRVSTLYFRRVINLFTI